MTDGAVLVLGLPGAGKSTFLGALWYTLENPPPDSSLSLLDLAGDRTYLTKLREDWLSCEPVPRNTERKSQPVELRISVEGEGLALAFPDHSGELFRDALNEREWSRDLDAIVSDCDGVVLFVHSVDFDEPTSFSEVADLVEEVGSESAPQPEQTQAFDPDRAPTQSKLVDLLQVVSSSAREPLPLAVIISAWDRAASDSEPTSWLVGRMPLLAQYLHNNRSYLRVRVWGVSAQGGHYPTDRERLLANADPAERILVQSGTAASNDLAVPLTWILSNDG